MKRPLIIGVGAAHSRAGKTTLIEALLKYLTRDRGQTKDNKESVSCPLSSVFRQRWGAVKYTRTDFYSSVTDDRKILDEKGKDTARMLGAGAEEVLWAQSPVEELREVLPIAVDRLSHLDGIIVEGNSAIEFLKPDIVIFLEGASVERTKLSGQRVREQADIIIDKTDGGHKVPSTLQRPAPSAAILQISRLTEKTIRELAELMDNIIRHKALSELLEERSAGGRIACEIARKIAEELGIPYREVGEAADRLKIRIMSCELGCF